MHLRPIHHLLLAFLGLTGTLAQVAPTPTSTRAATPSTTARSVSFTSTAAPTRTTASSSSVVSSAPTSSKTRESTEYYPSGPGISYDDDDAAGTVRGSQPVSDSNGGGAGNSDAFMGVGVGAQIGIIAAVVVVALALFIGIVIYYFHRKKQWEREVKRRSALPMNAKLVVGRRGEVMLADRSSTASKVGLEELEKGGHDVKAIEGEVKPGVWKMLLGKF